MDKGACWATVHRVTESDITEHTQWQVMSCPTLCDPVDYSPPGSSVHGIFQATILEWDAISYFRGSSQTRDQTHISSVSCTAGWFFTTESPRKPGRYKSKTTMRYHFALIRIATIKKKKQEKESFGKDVGKSKHLCIAGGNVKCCSHCETTVWQNKRKPQQFLKKLNRELPYDPAIPLWIYTSELKTGTETGICAVMFTAVLFTKSESNPPNGCNSNVHQHMNG